VAGAGGRPLVTGRWWQVAGRWWQVAGGRWLVAGGWWLVAGGWWLVAGGNGSGCLEDRHGAGARARGWPGRG
jgi:hypothetical protein